MPKEPVVWHDRVDKAVLLTALFGIHTKVHFRCRACHSKEPHIKYLVRPRDLQPPGTASNPIVIQ
jgi:hypothetical protein